MDDDAGRDRDKHGCEKIVDAAGEGFGVTVWGKREPDGTWRFHNESSTMEIDEESLDLVSTGGEWPCESPEETLKAARDLWAMSANYVHPEFRERVWRLVKKLGPRRGDWRYEPWNRHGRDSWREACHQPPRRKR